MKKEKILRYSVLILFFIFFSFLSIRHYILGGKIAPSIDALCPFGGFETLYTLITTGKFVPAIFASSLILAIGIIITVIILRRGFCGYICPFGTVQELIGKLNKQKFELPKKIDNLLKYAKYIILAIILIGTAYTGTLIFRNYDPFLTFFHFGKGIFWGEGDIVYSAIIITVITLILSIIIKRAWCRYFCPLAATMNLFTWFGLTKIKRDKKTCIDCKICDRACPMKVEISTKNYVKDPDCISCSNCINICPKKSLSYKIFGKKISVIMYIILLISIFAIIITGSMITGIWQSTQSFEAKDGSPSLTADDIKGWMTLSQVSQGTQICISHFIADLNLPKDIDPNTPLKEISKKYNIPFETSMLREYVKNFKHDESTNIYSPECPWGLKNDPAPGKCGLYIDQDHNNNCDYSE